MDAEKQQQLEVIVRHRLESKINSVFISAHEFAGTKSGDISPEQQLELDKLTEQLKELIVKQTLQNL